MTTPHTGPHQARGENFPGHEVREPQRVGYTTRWVAQTMFPYRKTDERIRSFQDQHYRITVVGYDGLPYGRYPRLILPLIITTAYHQHIQAQEGKITEEEARRINLGETAADFLEMLGMSRRSSGGKNGPLNRVREQIDRLAACSIKVEDLAKTNRSTIRRAEPALEISNHHELWLPHTAKSRGLTPSYMDLTPEFCTHIIDTRAPIDLDLLQRINGPRTKDLYVSVSMKKYWLLKSRRPYWDILWDELYSQFSTQELVGWRQKSIFRRTMAKSLAELNQHWEDAGVEIIDDGIRINQGPLSVPELL